MHIPYIHRCAICIRGTETAQLSSHANHITRKWCDGVCMFGLWVYLPINHLKVCSSPNAGSSVKDIPSVLQGHHLPDSSIQYIVFSEQTPGVLLKPSTVCPSAYGYTAATSLHTSRQVINPTVPLSEHGNSGLRAASLAQCEKPADDPPGFAEKLSSAELQLLVALVHTGVHLPEVLDGRCV